MPAPASLAKWSAVHTGSSLAGTLLMLLLCLTGLPLVFHHEIGHWLGMDVQPPTLASDMPRASLDRVVAAAQAQHAGKVPQSVWADEDDDRLWFVTLGDTPGDVAGRETVVVDARTAMTLAAPRVDEGFMHLVLRLHTDLFAGLTGTLLLGLTGLLLLASIVSGIVLYGPFMRKLPFGTLRRGTQQAYWLDLHNLLGIVTLAWALVVAATGVVNTLAEPLVALWRMDQLSAMVGTHDGAPPPRPWTSMQAALDTAHASKPGMITSFVAFPGTEYSSGRHYAVFLRGDTPLTSRLLAPVLVDAQSGAAIESRRLPWYIVALLVSQPLHFGDYGGWPLKIVWALLDVATIVVLLSGLCLWIKRRPSMRAADARAAS